MNCKKFILCVIGCFVLISCSSIDTTSPNNAESTLKQDRFLVSSWNRYTLEVPGTSKLPSENEYLNDPAKWQQWKIYPNDNRGVLTPVKIVGLVPAGTRYTLTIHTEGNTNFISQSFYMITFTNGPFKGTTAMMYGSF